MDVLSDNFDIPEIEGLHVMSESDIEKFAECAAQAYKEYPLFKYLTNGSCEHHIIKNIIQASIIAMKTQVIGVATKEDANAIALFTPPKYKGTKTIPFLKGGGLKLLFSTSPAIYLRLLRYEMHAMKIKEKYTNHDCWYLYNLTVKPEEQNKGNASKLLRPMLEYLDRINQKCYLETHKEENVKIYEHFGFELIEISTIPHTEMKQYSMLRNPKNEE